MKRWMIDPTHTPRSPKYNSKFSQFPDTVMVAMTDGYETKWIPFRRDIAQPAPNLFDFGTTYDEPKKHATKKTGEVAASTSQEENEPC